MDKGHLVRLTMIGIASLGLIAGGCRKNGTQPQLRSGLTAAEQSDSDMRKLYNSLSPAAQKKFDELDAEHKKMLMDMLFLCDEEKSSKAEQGDAEENDIYTCNPNKAVDAQYRHQMEQKR